MRKVIEDEVARWTRELRKGTTRLALLALLHERESYGYEILSDLKARDLEALNTTEATVYPLLHDLERRDFLTSQWRTTDEGVPPRKYYRLTATGLQLYETLLAGWTAYRDEIDGLLATDPAPTPADRKTTTSEKET